MTDPAFPVPPKGKPGTARITDAVFLAGPMHDRIEAEKRAASVFEPAEQIDLLDFTDWTAPDAGALFGVSGSNIIGSESVAAVDMRLDFLAAMTVFADFWRFSVAELEVKAVGSRYWAQRLRYRVEKDRKARIRAICGGRR